jgi:riboflavin synthase
MFTGIITDIGTVEAITPLDEGIKLKIVTAYDP